MKKLLLILAVALLLSLQAFSQDFLGYNYNSFQTAGGMIFNPASIAGSRYKINVNILSVNVGAINNGYEFKKSSFFDDMVEGEDFFKISNSSRKSMYMNADILGPSFMMDFGPKIGAFGFSSRIRVLTSEKNLENDIFQLFGNSNQNYFNKQFTQNDLMLDIHAFSDYGLSYARTVWANNYHVVKGGVTLKYVKGLAGGSFRADKLKVNIDIDDLLNEEKFNELEGNVSLLYSDAIDVAFGDDAEFSDVWDAANNSNGFGIDFGAEYEWYRDGAYQPNIENMDVWRNNILTPYTLKASISVTDIGSVKYNASVNAANYSVDMTGQSTSVLDMDGDDLNDYINRLEESGYIEKKGSKDNYRMSLPTLLRFNVDWKAYKGLFVNAGATMNLLGKAKHGARYANHYYVTPRYENNWMAVYSPISINSLKQLHWGVGVNLGAFFIGSGSILSNLFSSKLKGADIHLGFSVPIRQKRNEIAEIEREIRKTEEEIRKTEEEIRKTEEEVRKTEEEVNKEIKEAEEEMKKEIKEEIKEAEEEMKKEMKEAEEEVKEAEEEMK